MEYYVLKNVRCGRAQTSVDANTIYDVPGDFPSDISAEISRDFQDLTELGLAKVIVSSSRVFTPAEYNVQRKSIRRCDLPANANRLKKEVPAVKGKSKKG